MIGLIIKTLNSIPIVSIKNIVDLKHYLVSNYPDLDAGTMQEFVVEFISKTIDSCLTYFSTQYRQPLRQLVLDNARKINVFEVYASDILKAGLQLGSEFPAFQREIANWVGEFQVDNLAKEAVVNYILNCCQSKLKPGIKPGMVLSSAKPLPHSAPVLQTDPHAQTVVMKLNHIQPKSAKEEPQFMEKWYNPYIGQESSDDEGREATAAKGGSEAGRFAKLALWWRKRRKLLMQKLHNSTKNRNICIAAVIFLFLVISFPRLINSKTKEKSNLPVAGKLKIAVWSRQQARPRLNPVSSKAVNVPVVPGPNQVQGAGDVVLNKELSRKITPVLDTQNIITIGYVKEKTAAGTVEVPVRRYFERKMQLKASAYDLSLASCGKELDHPEYGITRTGTRAKRGRTIAVDPRVIPLGRKVYIVFPKQYSHMNGIYVAEDTGRKIKGYRIDIFWGEDGAGEKQIRREARAFGRRKVEIYLLQD
jgi:3D (Asp-Asp-Asp) domain-containing protein